MCILIAWFQAQSDINPIKELKGRILKSGSPKCVCHTQTHTHVTANCTSACSALSSNESPPALPWNKTSARDRRRERDREHDVGKKVKSEVWIMCYLFKSEIQMKCNPSADTTARGSNGSVCIHYNSCLPLSVSLALFTGGCLCLLVLSAQFNRQR